VTALGRALSAERIAAAVEEYRLSPLGEGVPEQFSSYFDLLQRWNAKLNLTAIRDPEDALRRHFVECIFCAQSLPARIETLLDYGSGGGFPGVPIALCRPEIRVTLAESQGKKASFLREAVRLLKIDAEVYAGRVEDMEPERRFGAVAMRAVDKMQVALGSAGARVDESGWLVLLMSSGGVELPGGFRGHLSAIPGSENGVLVLASRNVPGSVPRETLSSDVD
jgi:16S rRNA (guanine527-N7)-methyltransferase